MDITAILKKNEGITVLVLVGIFVSILDIYTSYILRQLGYREANPFMRYLMVNFGIWSFVVVNFILSILVISFLTWGSLEKLEGKFRYVPLVIYCVIRAVAVVNNMLIVF